MGGRGRPCIPSLMLCSPFLIATFPPSLPPFLSSQDITRGFGFVHFEHAGDAAAAIDNMEGAELLGTCFAIIPPSPSLPPLSLPFLFLLCLNLLVGDGISSFLM